MRLRYRLTALTAGSSASCAGNAVVVATVFRPWKETELAVELLIRRGDTANVTALLRRASITTYRMGIPLLARSSTPPDLASSLSTCHRSRRAPPVAAAVIVSSEAGGGFARLPRSVVYISDTESNVHQQVGSEREKKGEKSLGHGKGYGAAVG